MPFERPKSGTTEFRGPKLGHKICLRASFASILLMCSLHRVSSISSMEGVL